LIFGKNIKGRYNKELIKKGTNCRFSNAITRIKAIAIYLQLVTYINAFKYIAIQGLKGRFVAI